MDYDKYVTLLRHISVNNGPPYLPLLTKHKQNVLIENPPPESSELNNQIMFQSITSHINILILSMLSFIYQYEYLLEKFKIYLVNLKNPISELKVKFGDLTFKLENVSVIPLFKFEPGFKIKQSKSNYELLESYSDVTTSYLCNKFTSGLFPIFTKTDNLNPSIGIKYFLVKFFAEYLDLGQFSLLNFDVPQLGSSLFIGGRVYKDSKSTMFIVLDSDINAPNMFYLYNTSTRKMFKYSVENFTRIFKEKEKQNNYSTRFDQNRNPNPKSYEHRLN